MSSDDEVPDVDAYEQEQEVAPTADRHDRPVDDEVPEADALGQSMELIDDEER